MSLSLGALGKTVLICVACLRSLYGPASTCIIVSSYDPTSTCIVVSSYDPTSTCIIIPSYDPHRLTAMCFSQAHPFLAFIYSLPLRFLPLRPPARLFLHILNHTHVKFTIVQYIYTSCPLWSCRPVSWPAHRAFFGHIGLFGNIM